MTRLMRFGVLLAGLAGLPGGLAAADGQGFGITVLVDGTCAPEYAARGRVYIEALRGKEFVIRLSNPTSERIAVALSVDGRNVVDAGRTSARAATKWVLMPGQTADIPGWQVSGQTSRKFFFTETSRSYAKWLGDTSNVGTIEAVFFREKRRDPILTWKDERPAGGRAGETAQAPSAEADSERAGAGPADSAKRQKARESERFAATGIGDQTRFPVQWVQFEEDPNPAARIAIRYEFREQLVRLGVLPREDDLFARDDARGFEHAYAPDPYRHR
jgi:hypothetical protein